MEDKFCEKSSKTVTTRSALHRRFSEILENNGLVQIVEEPTRKHNTLDLVITNRPSKVLRVEFQPGISDHDIVFTEFDMKPIKYKEKPHQVHVYRKTE